MKQVILVLAYLAFVSRTEAVVQTPLSPSLAENISRHESHNAGLVSARVVWSTTIHDRDATRVEEFETLLSPGIEMISMRGGDVSQRVRWDNQSFEWMMNFDAEQYASNPLHIEKVAAYRYREDLSLKRLFQWRTLRAYRMMASDADLSLRELCLQSPEPPSLSEDGGLIRISLVHPGTVLPDGALAYSGSKVLAILDPQHGYSVVEYHTALAGTTPEESMVQKFQVREFKQFDPGLFLPVRVDFSLETADGTHTQDIVFDFFDVNQPLAIPATIFVEDLLVKDFQRYGEENAKAFYVVGSDGTLGKAILDEVQASKVRFDRLGLKGVSRFAMKHGGRARWILLIVIVNVLMLLLAAWFISKRRARKEL